MQWFEVIHLTDLILESSLLFEHKSIVVTSKYLQKLAKLKTEN